MADLWSQCNRVLTVAMSFLVGPKIQESFPRRMATSEAAGRAIQGLAMGEFKW